MSGTTQFPVSQIGPVRIDAACAFQSRVGTLGTELLIPCQAVLRNTSGVTQYFTAQTVVPNQGNSAFTTQTTRVLYPGQTATLPNPPHGQAWLVVLVSRTVVSRVVDEFEWVGIGILGFAVYGLVEAIKQRKTIWQRVKRIF